MRPRPSISARLGAAVLVALVLLLPAPRGTAVADAQERSTPESVKASFLFNFANTRVVQWPRHRFPRKTTPVVIGVVGHDSFGAGLPKALHGKVANKRPVRVVRIEPLKGTPQAEEHDARVTDRMRDCHLLFICTSESKRLQPILDRLETKPVLTVSHVRNFARDGGMIELVLGDDGKITPHVNREASEACAIQFNSQFLNLATIVKTRRQ